jgi:hypothetical protein
MMPAGAAAARSLPEHSAGRVEEGGNSWAA